MKSKIPVRTWFMCIHLMTSIKKSMSALEMQRQLRMKRYEPVWFMMQKIRIAMGKRDGNYKLSGNIEIDDSFFEIVDLEKPDGAEQKRGRGSDKQQKVLVMVESEPNPKQMNPHKKKRIMGFVKMTTMDDLTSVGVNYEISKSVDKKSTVWTDAYSSFSDVGDVVGTAHQRSHAFKKSARKIAMGACHDLKCQKAISWRSPLCWQRLLAELP